MNEEEYSLVMPFITTKEHGGPHDGASYVAGYEMGSLDARLSACVHHKLGCPEVIIHRENIPQAELLAMHYKMLCEEVEMDLHDCENADEVRAEWAHLRFKWASYAF